MSLKEYGFWEYTCPGAGECSHYEVSDWERLLDDMAGGGMNSLALVIKWLTTGYKTSLKWLDQDNSCKVIASDNKILLETIKMAQERNIKIWLVAVCSHFQIKEFGIEPPNHKKEGTFFYDPDYPGVLERMVSMFEEIAKIFGSAYGIVVEMESVEYDWPHRIPLYNEWAREKGRESYEQLKNLPLDARAYSLHSWRDFLTWRRCLALKEIERAVRGVGFKGNLSMICETGNETGSYHQAINLKDYKELMPGWGAVTYDYDRDLNRWAGADFCMVQPKKTGLTTYYLGRGIMTYAGGGRSITIPLEDHWKIDIEDILKFNLDGFWFFGADAGGENSHCSLKKLSSWGFKDGITARRQLLEIGRDIRLKL